MADWQVWFCIIVMALIGVFCICGAVCSWDWFFENSRSRFFIRMFGRTGARIAYGVLGVLIVAMSVVSAVYRFYS